MPLRRLYAVRWTGSGPTSLEQGLGTSCAVHPHLLFSPGQAERRQAATCPLLFLCLSFPHFLHCRLVWVLFFLFLLWHSFIPSFSSEHSLEHETIESNLPIAERGNRLRKRMGLLRAIQVSSRVCEKSRFRSHRDMCGGVWGLDLSGFLLSQLSHHKITLAPNALSGLHHAGIFFPLEK